MLCLFLLFFFTLFSFFCICFFDSFLFFLRLFFLQFSLLLHLFFWQFSLFLGFALLLIFLQFSSNVHTSHSFSLFLWSRACSILPLNICQKNHEINKIEPCINCNWISSCTPFTSVHLLSIRSLRRDGWLRRPMHFNGRYMNTGVGGNSCSWPFLGILAPVL